MRPFFLFLFVIIIFKSSAQTINKQEFSSQIHSITVFLDGAEIYRTKKLSIEKGINKIEFTGLSPYINSNSIRVQLEEKFDLLSIAKNEDYLFNEDFRPELKKINDSISIIETQITKVKNELKAYHLEEEMLAKNQLVTNNNNLQYLANAASFFKDRYYEINTNVSNLTLKVEKLNAVLNRLNLQQDNVESKGYFERSKIIITLKSKEATTSEIGIKYLVNNAGWAAIYDIKASNINNPIELLYKAKVFNETEISWENVALKLSTTDPNRNITKPSLDPWEIKYGRYRKINIDNEKLYLSDKKEEHKNDTINKKSNVQMLFPVEDLNSEFIISGRYDIPSTSNPYFVEIGSYSLAATYKHYSAPKIENSAFLIAKVTGWEDINLITGKSNIYFNGLYIGQSIINPAEVSDTMDISLGRDNKVIVQRVKKKEFSNKQFIGTNQKETYAYETTIKNNRKESINIELLDQIPISLDSEIIVEKLESQGAIYNETEGCLKWNLLINADTSQSTYFSFSIKYPKNKSINVQKYGMRSIRYF